MIGNDETMRESCEKALSIQLSSPYKFLQQNDNLKSVFLVEGAEDG